MMVCLRSCCLTAKDHNILNSFESCQLISLVYLFVFRFYPSRHTGYRDRCVICLQLTDSLLFYHQFLYRRFFGWSYYHSIETFATYRSLPYRCLYSLSKSSSGVSLSLSWDGNLPCSYVSLNRRPSKDSSWTQRYLSSDRAVAIEGQIADCAVGPYWFDLVRLEIIIMYSKFSSFFEIIIQNVINFKFNNVIQIIINI